VKFTFEMTEQAGLSGSTTAEDEMMELSFDLLKLTSRWRYELGWPAIRSCPS